MRDALPAYWKSLWQSSMVLTIPREFSQSFFFAEEAQYPREQRSQSAVEGSISLKEDGCLLL
jgi:hypothetical protein